MCASPILEPCPQASNVNTSLRRLPRPPARPPVRSPSHWKNAEQTGPSPSPPAEVVFDDTFFVTGGGARADQTEASSPGAAGIVSRLKHPAGVPVSSPSSRRRPQSTPTPAADRRRSLAYLDGSERASGAAEAGAMFPPARRDVWTADASCLGRRRLCFRSRPIHDLVSSTLLRIDPSGVFSMYQEWSNIKNRVLSRECAAL